LRALHFLKELIPASARVRLHSEYDEYVLNKALKKFASDPARWMYPQSPVVHDLIRGWNNDGYSADDEFLVESIMRAMETKGPILECGSGLTTLLLGTVADSLGQAVWSLEHSAVWGEKVENALRKYQIKSVQLFVQPIKAFSGFHWYDAPVEAMPEFSLVICDGPPAGTPGGRYGLLPIMRKKLEPGAVILLDDAIRQDERTIAARWADELRTDFQIRGLEKPYVVLTVPGA
jgi:hypothetical protein